MDYSIFKIKTYDHWDLFLHSNQVPYIGRCYAAAIREDANFVTDMNNYESEELFSKVILAWDKTVQELFGKSRPNVAILGNDWPHLHAHLIPRFKEPKIFYGIKFIDPNPTGNYSPYPKKDISLEILMDIKEKIVGKLIS